MTHTVKRKWWLIIISMVLVVAVTTLLAACGGDDGNDETASATSQATTTTSSQPTTTTTSTDAESPTPSITPDTEPVKIGVVTAWTGPMAMMGTFYVDTVIKTVEKQLEDMGGILGGRPLEFVRYDTGGEVAKATAGVTKLITKDKVSVLTVGGASPAEFAVTSDAAEEEKVLFVSVGPVEGVWETQYTVEGSISYQSTREDAVRLVLELLTPRPQTFAFISFDDPSDRYSMEAVNQELEAAGIEIVYGQYLAPDINDLSPYLTKIKYEDPDCLYLNVGSNQFLAIAKQIMELGGWGDIQVTAVGTASSAMRMPGAEGWIVATAWHPSNNDPESVKFKEYHEVANGKLPTDMHVYFYNALWTAIHAVEQAGTDDPMEIARFARSGDLEFDTPMGRQHYGPDGVSILHQMYVQIQEGGVVVPFP